MITDADIKKLKTVFATKEDLNRFITKDDAKKFATKNDLTRYATKEDLQESTNQLIELITAGFGRMDTAIEKLNDHDEILDNHGRRLDKIEDKVFA